MKKFDTRVQYLKYKVLREVAKLAFEDRLLEGLCDIPQEIIPGKHPTMRCCVFKERAIINERVKVAMGGDRTNPNVIEVISLACDECPRGGYEITDNCRGCIAHRCGDVCPRNAITFDLHQKAHIDKSKCVQCGKCAKVCPYNSIANRKRPCEAACKVNAITMADEGEAYINNNKCIACGSCVYQCPFGAITDKSYILDAVGMLKNSNEKTYPIYAVVAPSIATQFTYAKLGQVFAGMFELGFTEVKEAALGADMVALAETQELAERGFMTSSCCPAFVSYVEKQFPDMLKHVSHSQSPAAVMGKYIKDTVPGAKVIFIGPCTAKKMEAQRESVRDYIDCVLTFEELQALFDAKGIDIWTLNETDIADASGFGRVFARSGGLSIAVTQGLEEQGISDFVYNPAICDGIEQCHVALLKASKGVLKENFIEGMACIGGCIGGAGCLTHGDRDQREIDKYMDLAPEKSILSAVQSMS